MARSEAREAGGRVYDGPKAADSETAWTARTVSRMQDWGFHTAGAWCDESVYAPGFLHTRYLRLSAEVGGVKERPRSSSVARGTLFGFRIRTRGS